MRFIRIGDKPAFRGPALSITDIGIEPAGIERAQGTDNDAVTLTAIVAVPEGEGDARREEGCGHRAAAND